MKKKTLNEKGFTLVETMMVVAILPIIFIALFSVMEMASTIFQTNTVYARLNTSAMQSLRYISREVGESSPLATPDHLDITTDTNANSVLRFQIPVDWDNDGDAVTTGLNPSTEWGVYHDAGSSAASTLNGWAEYSVNASNQLVRNALDSTLTTIAGTEKVISQNVQSFTVSQSSNTLTMNLALTATDEIGQAGETRDQNWTFTSETTLRNAVN